MKILLLENDIDLAKQLENFLMQQHHEIYMVNDIEEAEELAYSSKFDFMILDSTGFELLKELRKIHNNTPSILITSLSDILDIKKIYDIGFNDFIKKPFELNELEIRLNYLKQLHNIEDSSLLTINATAKLDMQNLSIIKDTSTIYLPKKEAKIMKYFLLNKNRIVDINELLINIWPYDNSPSIATIRTYLKNIRKIIGAEHFTTVKGSGYRFNFI